MNVQVTPTWCPECGMVWRDGRPVCPFNGADAGTIPIHEAVADHLVEAASHALEDDGTILRFGGVAVGRAPAAKTAYNGAWFVTRYRAGEWSGTVYRRTLRGVLLEAARMEIKTQRQNRRTR